MANKKSKKGRKFEQPSNAKRIIIPVVIIAFLALLVFSYLPKSNDDSNSKVDFKTTFDFNKQGELTFTSSENNFLKKIDIEIADNDEKRAEGLMYRTEMADNQGMLFIFPREEMQSFWMRNTGISLDILFVNADNKIVTIHNHTETYSDNSYPSTAPAKFVVEVNAGFCEKYNINEGDKISWRRFK